ncbi:MAG: TIM barrel protein [Verrucomicrobia bacterium]|nr:TIM barrel protein [Verrucomicrobiota bacterium]
MPRIAVLCLNRIIKPQIPLEEFLRFTADLGIKYVEVRNDFTDKGVLDGLSDGAVQKAFTDTSIQALTINALYPFEDGRMLMANLQKLKELIAEAGRIRCPQIVMCPLNDAADPRSPAQRADELVAALNAYGPVFAEANMTGLIEPLGFPICSLRTKKAALEGIARCNYPDCYRLLHDTFHHYLSGETEFFPNQTAVVHVSGLLAGKSKAETTDEDRVLVTRDDVMDNRGQVATLLADGCTAPISYEPFSSQVRSLPLPELKAQLQQSIDYLFA